MITSDKPLYRYSAKMREDSARHFVGREVVVVEHPGRFKHMERQVVGLLVSVANSPSGSGASIIVVRVEGNRLDSAITLANVARIRLRGESCSEGMEV